MYRATLATLLLVIVTSGHFGVEATRVAMKSSRQIEAEKRRALAVLRPTGQPLEILKRKPVHEVHGLLLSHHDVADEILAAAVGALELQVPNRSHVAAVRV